MNKRQVLSLTFWLIEMKLKDTTMQTYYYVYLLAPGYKPLYIKEPKYGRTYSTTVKIKSFDECKVGQKF